MEIFTPFLDRPIPGHPRPNDNGGPRTLAVTPAATLTLDLDRVLIAWPTMALPSGYLPGNQLPIDFVMDIDLHPDAAPTATCATPIPQGPHLLVRQIKSPSA